jgi:hypothetical protein
MYLSAAKLKDEVPLYPEQGYAASYADQEQ